MELAKGTIGAVKAFEIPAEKRRQNKYGKTPTHRISFVLQEKEGVWFNCGESTKDHLDVKVNGQYETLTRGCQVEFIYDINGNYNNVKASNIKLIAKPAQSQAPAQQPASQSQPSASAPQAPAAKPYRKASSGDLVGHAIKCVCGLGVAPSASNFTDLAKQVFNMTAGLKKAYAAAHPELSDYETGAAVGMAVEQLCRAGVSLEEIPEKVKEILIRQVDLKAYVESGGDPVAFDWNNISSTVSAAPSDDDDNTNVFFDDEPPMDFDDDIPF